MGLHNAFAVKLGSTVISGLTQLNAQTNPTVESESSSGSHFPQFAVITGQKPRVMFNSRQAAALLGLTGLTGAVIDGSSSLVAYFAALGTNGLPASGSVHRSYTSVRGLLVPRRLQCQGRGNLQVDAEALVYSADGAAHPFVIADNVNLPSVVVNNIQHTLGPIAIGVTGTVITPDCINNVSIDFGSNADTLACGSALYDQHVEQPRIAPVITLTGINAAVFGGSGAVPPVGLALAHAATTLYFRKRNPNGIGFTADATAEHIKLTANGIAVVTQHTGQGTSRAEVTIQITTAWDGSTAPLTINTASAIT